MTHHTPEEDKKEVEKRKKFTEKKDTDEVEVVIEDDKTE
jgi:hypothetical protein